VTDAPATRGEAATGRRDATAGARGPRATRGAAVGPGVTGLLLGVPPRRRVRGWSKPRQAGRLQGLDGLRGVAVTTVVGFHLGITGIRGGVLGVDIFFVLSGFLITGLLLAEWRAGGRISLRRFWVRRARRLLPALLLVLTTVAVAERILAAPEGMPLVRGDILATLFYVANLHSILAGHSYFASFAAPSPLLHTWSLAIEEQFYLVWPLVAAWALTRRRSPRLLLGVAVVAALASSAAMTVLSLLGTSIDRLYYGTDTRAQSLLFGAALAGVFHSLGRDFTGRRHDGRTIEDAPARRSLAWALSVAGIGAAAVLAWAVVSLGGTDPLLYRWGFTLVEVAVAAVIAAVVLVPGGPLNRVLAAWPLASLGRISYGIYLWHWPVIVFLTPARTGMHGNALLILRLTVTIALSALSFRLVERPIRERRMQIPRPRLAVPVLVGGLAVVVALDPLPAASPVATLLAQAAPPPPPPAATAHPTPAAMRQPLPPRIARPAVTHPGPLRVMLVGDSVARTLGVGIDYGAGPAGIVFANEGYVGCGIARSGDTSFSATYSQPQACLTWPERWLGWTQTFQPDVTLVLLGLWEIIDRTHLGQWMHIGEPTYDAYLKAELDLAIGVLTSTGGRVALLTAPCDNVALSNAVDPGRIPADGAQRVARWNQILTQAAQRWHDKGVTVVALDTLLCPGGNYLDSVGGVPLRYGDGVHLQPLAGQMFVRQQLPQVLAWLRTPVPTPQSTRSLRSSE